MSKKIVLIISFMLISFYGTAQKDINNYKYIIVPKKFDFSKSEDQYQLNSLTKFLFNKYGYEAYFGDDDLPKDLEKNRCLALTSEVSNGKGGMFKTKVEIILKDCFGATVMTSAVGMSRVKEYDKSYNEAIRNAFKTFQTLNYKYVPKEAVTLESEKEDVAEVVKGDVENKIDKVPLAVPLVAAVSVSAVDHKTEGNSELYYAQAIENGFQIVNAEPKIVMLLLTTAAENVFIVKGKNAIVFKEDGFWYYSENNGTLSDKTRLNIKF